MFSIYHAEGVNITSLIQIETLSQNVSIFEKQNRVLSIKQSPVLKGHIFFVLL